MTIDEFIIKLGIDSSALQKGVAAAKQAVSNMAKSVKTSLASMTTGISNGIGSIFEKSISMWGGFIKSFVQKFVMGFAAGTGAAFAFFVRGADRLGKSAKDIGVTVETLSTLETVAKRAGGSTEELEKDMKSLAEETGGNAYGALKSLAEIADEMGEADYTSYAESLGLSQTTIDMTKEGTEALKKQIIAAKELGIINRQDAKDAKELKQAILDLVLAFRSIVNVGARMIIPGLKKVAEAFKNVVVFLRKNEQFVKFFFIGLATVITATAIPAILALSAAMLASPFTWMVAAVAALALALDDMFGWMDGKEAAWGDFWAELWGTDDPNEAKEKLENLKQSAIEFFDTLKDNLPTITEMWEFMVRGVMGLKTGIEMLFSPLTNLITVFNSVKDAWDNTIGKLEFPSLPSFGGGGATTEQKKADGGIFTSPTHALIGEAGAEAVIPFSPGKRNRGLELLSKIAGNLMPNISAANALPMGGASTNNITTDTRVTVGTVNISAADGTDAANQFMTGVERRAQMWTAAANVAY